MKLLDSAGPNKDSALVPQAFASIQATLDNIQVFHTDCRNEFENKVINEILTKW